MEQLKLNKHYHSKNINKLKKQYKFNVEYCDDNFYFNDVNCGRNYKTHSQLKQWQAGLIRKKPKDSWNDEKTVANYQINRSWKKNSKRKRQFTK